MHLRSSHAAALVAAFTLYAGAAHAAPNSCMQANQDAQDLRKNGQLREARAQLLVCAAKSCNAVIRSDCEKWLREVDEETPTIVVRVVDSRGQDVLGGKVTIDDARIELDGKPVTVDPGQRTIKARAKSGDVAETKVLVVLKEKARVVEVKFPVELSPDGTKPGSQPPSSDTNPPHPSNENEKKREDGPSLTVPITLAVVGGVALGAFGFFEITGHSGYDDLKSSCATTAKGCSDEQIDPVKSKFVAAAVSLGVGVVALGAAAVVYFTSKSSAPASAFRWSPVLRF